MSSEPSQPGGGGTHGAAAPRRSALGFVTRRPIAITMFVLALVVFGVVSLSKLSVDLLPEISYPTLTVRTSWPGAAPEDVEQRISERLQESLNTLPDLVRSTSISRAGTSDVVLDFDWGTNMTFAVQDVREKLDGIVLPRGAEKPLILRFDPNLDPILRVGVSSTDAGADLIELRWVAENRIKRELETIPGVAAVVVRGGLEEEIRVRVDPYKLAARHLGPAAVAQRLEQENINASGGSLLEGSTEYLVRTVNEFANLEEIANLALVERGEAVLRVRDVAEVERTHKKRQVVTRIGGSEAVEVAIYREAGANIVDVAARVKARVFGTAEQQAAAARLAEARSSAGGKGSADSKARADGEGRAGGEGARTGTAFGDRAKTDFLAFRLRRSVKLEPLSDQSVFIADAVDDVKQAAGLGAVLAVLIIWLFLRRLSSTVVIGAAIPISVVVTFAPMYLMDVSLNIMSLGGLALGVGMLVDNAIVVLESITRCREEGDGIAEAAVRGVHEVAGAVVASTLTTIAVFAPIVFVTGIAGQIFGDQALVVVTSLFVSLLVAVLFIPMLASRPFLAGPPGTSQSGTSQSGTSQSGASPDAPEAAAARAHSRPSLLGGLSFSGAAFLPSAAAAAGRLVMQLATGVLALVMGLFALVNFIGGLLLKPVALAFNAVWSATERSYLVLLRGALAAPLLVVALAGGLLWDASQRVSGLGLELLPEIHQGEFTAHVQLYVGSPLENTDAVMSELDREVRALAGVQTTALTVGVEPDTLSREIEGPHTARLTVRLAAPTDGKGHQLPITADLETALEQRVGELIQADPAVRSVEFTRPTPFALESPIAVEVRGHDLLALTEVARDVRERLAAVEGLVSVRSTVRPGHPEARVIFDRDKTLEYGLDLNGVSNMVRDQVLGNVSTRLPEGDDRIDIRVIGDEAILASLDDVLDLVVNPEATAPVPLRAVAEVVIALGPAEIRRIGNTRAVVVTATSSGLDLGHLNQRIDAALADLDVPDDVRVELGGQKRELDASQASMRGALLLAVFLVYVVMASQFESVVQPLIILLTVPLAGVGVVYALELLNIPLSVVVFIGLIMLAGIVVNNAIVLVDRINQMRQAGLERRAAVVEACQARLRPILMTTATTVLGLLPLTGWLASVPLVGLLGSGEGAEIRAPMAITVITGLVSSTLLTLLVIPAVYLIVARRAPRAMDPELEAELQASEAGA